MTILIYYLDRFIGNGRDPHAAAENLDQQKMILPRPSGNVRPFHLMGDVALAQFASRTADDKTHTSRGLILGAELKVVFMACKYYLHAGFFKQIHKWLQGLKARSVTWTCIEGRVVEVGDFPCGA